METNYHLPLSALEVAQSQWQSHPLMYCAWYEQACIGLSGISEVNK